MLKENQPIDEKDTNKPKTKKKTKFRIWKLFLFIIIVLISPIENKNKPIGSKKQYIKLKIIGSLLFAAAGFVGTVLLYYNLNEYGTTVLYTLHLITLLAVIGLIIEMKERRKSKNEEQ